ncbi:MAG TPA: hypothetical protein VGV35_20425 [Bryobacteraceae bacterium]|nr:hypothetical protein [Bryobacteraceae bacterium]
MPEPNRLLIAMADADWKSHVVDGVLNGPDGATYQWTRPTASFRLTPNDVRALQFYMRFTLVDDSFRQTGAVTIAISINGHELDRPRMTNSGEREYVHGVPDGWITAGRPVTIALDVEPALITSRGDKLGVLLHSIGFKK